MFIARPLILIGVCVAAFGAVAVSVWLTVPHKSVQPFSSNRIDELLASLQPSVPPETANPRVTVWRIGIIPGGFPRYLVPRTAYVNISARRAAYRDGTEQISVRYYIPWGLERVENFFIDELQRQAWSNIRTDAYTRQRIIQAGDPAAAMVQIVIVPDQAASQTHITAVYTQRAPQ